MAGRLPLTCLSLAMQRSMLMVARTAAVEWGCSNRSSQIWHVYREQRGRLAAAGAKHALIDRVEHDAGLQ